MSSQHLNRTPNARVVGGAPARAITNFFINVQFWISHVSRFCKVEDRVMNSYEDVVDTIV
jgi:hypothetical protein